MSRHLSCNSVGINRAFVMTAWFVVKTSPALMPEVVDKATQPTHWFWCRKAVQKVLLKCGFFRFGPHSNTHEWVSLIEVSYLLFEIYEIQSRMCCISWTNCNWILQTVVTLYRVSDASGEVTVDKVGEKPLHQDMLNSTVCKQIEFCLLIIVCFFFFFFCECISICLHEIF
jgi:hypothetical protein